MSFLLAPQDVILKVEVRETIIWDGLSIQIFSKEKNFFRALLRSAVG